MLPAVAIGNDATWDLLRSSIFQEKEIIENDQAVQLTVPARADDAALVPIKIIVPENFAKSLRTLTIIVDKNPAPIAAKINFGFAAGWQELLFETRIRVDANSNIRAIIELGNGDLYMSSSFIKAAGGCSAPALKDMDQTLKEAGEIRIKKLESNQAQIMIKHPQYSGLQINQVTGYYIPANFLDEIIVSSNEGMIFRVEGGISLSEDPHFRFSYRGGDVSVVARATDNRIFRKDR